MEIATGFETPRGRGWGSIPSTNFSHIRYQMVDPRGDHAAEAWVRVPYVTTNYGRPSGERRSFPDSG